MNVEEAAEMCKEIGCHANINVYVSEKGEVTVRQVGVWGAKRKDILKWRKRHNIPKMTKKYYDWQFDNVKFNEVEQCKVVRYKTEHVPAHTRRVAVYDCKNGEVVE